MAVTLKTISERLGLSQAAVSQILNRKPNDLSSESTRKKVFAMAEELGYKQKFGHKLLRGDRTKTVCILSSQYRLNHEEQIQKLTGCLLELLEQHGYSSYVVTLKDDAHVNLEKVRELCVRGVESFIALGTPVGEMSLYEEIRQNGRELIGYNSCYPHTINVPPRLAQAEIIRFFLRENRPHFKIFLRNSLRKCLRFQGLRDVFPQLDDEELRRRYYINLGEYQTPDVDVLVQIGYEATRRAFEAEPDIEAVSYLSDYYVLGGIRYLVETGRTPGKDVLVAGYNDINAVRFHHFPITSVRHQVDEIAETLVKHIGSAEKCSQTINPEVIIRK